MTTDFTNPHRWYAVRCVSGREKRVCEAIRIAAANEDLDLDVYMPAATRLRRVRISRKLTIREKFDLALFPGIIFVWCATIDAGERTHIDPGQSAVIKGADDVREFYSDRDATGEARPAALPSRAVEQIRLRQFQGEFDETRSKEPDYTPAVGDKAFVADGDWVSQLGEIFKIQAKHGTATLLIDGRKVKAKLKTLRPDPKEEVAA